jgi:hypothetical protein
MTQDQINAIKCAFADLCGSMQAHQQCDINAHDWRAHGLTIKEMSNAFEFLDPIPTDIEGGRK